jgi:competence protein ComEA
MAMAGVVLVLWIWAMIWSVSSDDDEQASEGASLPAAKIDVNTADAATLEVLPSVGPAIARRLIAYRAKHGPFRSAADLLRVKGVTEELLRRIEPFLVEFDPAKPPVETEAVP